MNHFVSSTCKGEVCGLCKRQGFSRSATHKVGEELPEDFPGIAHNLTQYVCCHHFTQLFGHGAIQFRGCLLSPEAPL